MPDSFGIADADTHARADAHARSDPDHHVPDRDAPALPDAEEDALARVAGRAQGQGPQLTALVACVVDAGRVLIVKQTAGPFAGAWLLPGGSVERNERLEDAARRELLEERGYRMESLRPVAEYEVGSLPAGRFHFLVHLFRGSGLGGTP